MSNLLPKTQFAMNRQNMLVIRNRNLIIEYELFDNEEFGNNDHFELIASDESWQQEIPRSALKTEDGWLQLEFKNVPEGKSYHLYYVPEDENTLPFQIIEEFEYNSLKEPLEFELLELEEEDTDAQGTEDSQHDSKGGSSGNHEKDEESMTVKEIQQKLAELDYDPGPIDGINGPNTCAAIKEFQREHGLVVDGIAGPNTQNALKQVA